MCTACHGIHKHGGKPQFPDLADEAVYFPYGFVADNAESQLEGGILLRAEPRLASVVHLPCLNESPAYLAALADAVLEHAGADGQASDQIRASHAT